MIDDLRQEIEEFYLPKQLVEAIHTFGQIPEESEEVEAGIGFIDIADYTFLSKFLTPKENQQVLNGLYTAFNSVLRRRGGYLNKIEGDALMFQYGGLIDPVARSTEDPKEVRRYIARELFYTCVEMQRVTVLFNQADSRFMDDAASDLDRVVLEQAFSIIKRLREDSELAPSMNAMFQIRIRVGANVGEVTIGNFGPEGARQWDVIGFPVIAAKRMEATAPVGGLRVSEEYFRILEEIGVVGEYYDRFRREASALRSRYSRITRDELFTRKPVVVKDKKNAAFSTYSIQVNPELPEQIATQVKDLLQRGRHGARMIAELVEYHRGNRHVVEAVEETLVEAGVTIRRVDAFALMYPQRYERMKKQHGESIDSIEASLREEYSLFELLERLGRYQDLVKSGVDFNTDMVPFATYEEYLGIVHTRRMHEYETMKTDIAQRAYFFNVVYPMVFASIEAAVLEYQAAEEELEMI